MSARPRRRLLAFLVAFALALPFAACDVSNPTDTPAPTNPGNPGGENEGGENPGEENEGGENEGEEEEENQDPPDEGDLGGLFRVNVEPTSALLGGVTASFTGSAVFYVESDSERFVIALASNDVLNTAYPFEFVVFSTPDGLPDVGTYPLTLDLESSFMGGYAEVRGTDLIDIQLPISDEVYRLPPSAILQTFTGELVITSSTAERLEGTLSFQGFPIDTEAPPLFVRGESRATGFFEAILVDEEDAPEVDLDLYLPEDFEMP
ncbi:MAG: hypothetical protein AAF809_10435 [Bacteroidota bacterium]